MPERGDVIDGVGSGPVIVAAVTVAYLACVQAVFYVAPFTTWTPWVGVVTPYALVTDLGHASRGDVADAAFGVCYTGALVTLGATLGWGVATRDPFALVVPVGLLAGMIDTEIRRGVEWVWRWLVVTPPLALVALLPVWL